MREPLSIKQLSLAKKLKVFAFVLWLILCEASGRVFSAKEKSTTIATAHPFLRLTLALTAVFAAGAQLMEKDPYLGFAIILLYSATCAIYAVYEAVSLYLATTKKKAHWVGH